MYPKKRTADAVTLNGKTTGRKKSSLLLESPKPTIAACPQSELFQRIRGFLPQIEAANQNLTTAPGTDFEVVNCPDSSTDEDSDTTDDDTSSESDSETTIEETGAEHGKLVQLDINLFEAPDEVETSSSIETQVVDRLPAAFQKATAADDKKSSKKQLVQVLDP